MASKSKKGSHASASSNQGSSTTLTSRQRQQLAAAQRRVDTTQGRVQHKKKRYSKLRSQLKDAGKKETKQLKNQLQDILDAIAKQRGKLDKQKDTRNDLRKYEVTTGGVLNPPIDPYMRAEDMADLSQQTADLNALNSGLDSDLAEQAAQAILDKQQIDKQQLFDRRDASDSAAARGLAHSSIRDAEIYDIDATAALRRNMLDTDLRTSTLRAQDQKHQAGVAYMNWLGALHQKMVQNAAEDSAGSPQYLVEPKTVTKKLPKPGEGKGPGVNAGATGGNPHGGNGVQTGVNTGVTG